MEEIQLSRPAAQDLRAIDRASELRRIRLAFQDLAAGRPNLDVVALQGRHPWLRLRTGDWRIIYRPLEETEGSGFLVARIIIRRDLEQALKTL